MFKTWFNQSLVAFSLVGGVLLSAGCAKISQPIAVDNSQPVVLADAPTGKLPKALTNSSTGPTPVAAPQNVGAQHISWASLQGAPNFKPGSGEGIWVWNENTNGQNILRVAATTEGRRHVFTGTLRTGAEGNFWDLDRSHFESDDHASQPAYNEVHFDFTTYDGVDAFSVKWSGRDLALEFRNDGEERPYHVYYGASATPARGLPLLVGAGDEGLLTLPLSTISGATSFQKGAGDGYWIYSNANGIHIRTTTKSESDRKYYTGQIRGEMANVSLIAPDRDWIRWPNGDVADFGLRTAGGVDGIDLTLKGSSIVFTLRTDDRIAAPNIALGSNGFGMVHALTFRLK
jgi:hypothetical protein